MDAEAVYTAIVPADQWRRVSSSIRIRRGRFFKIDHLAMGEIAGGSFFVVSTVSTSHLEWTKSSPHAAGCACCWWIDALPRSLRRRVWWSSRTWKLLPDRPPNDEPMDCPGQLRASKLQIEEVLEAWGKKTTSCRGDGRWFGWTGRKFHVADHEWESFKTDMMDGCPLSKYHIELGLDPKDDFPGDDEFIPDNPFT
jgi:hypothetical protein